MDISERAKQHFLSEGIVMEGNRSKATTRVIGKIYITVDRNYFLKNARETIGGPTGYGRPPKRKEDAGRKIDKKPDNISVQGP